MGPLAGLKVVEIGGIGPGPTAGMILADLGANVILVERLSENPNAARTGAADDRTAAIEKRGKRSIALDLKNPAHVDVVLALAEHADILFEGFRPDVAERLGIGPEQCLARNPRLIYGRITGWGQTGPLAQAAGHDLNYLSITGAVHYSGLSGSMPFPPPTVVGDVGGGALSLVIGLLAAHAHAVRTGEGQVVDAAICDGAIYNMALLAGMHARGGLAEERGDDFVSGGAHWARTYACSDGKYITIQSLEPNFYCELLERCGLTDDPDFARQFADKSWPAASAKMAAMFAGKTRAEWCELLEGTDVCFAPVLSLSEAPLHPHNVARRNFIDTNGRVQPAPAPKFGLTRQDVGAIPEFGEHTREILAELRISAETITGLQAVHRNRAHVGE